MFFSSPKFTFSANLNSHICVNFCDLDMRSIAMSILHIRLKPKRAIHNSTEVEFQLHASQKRLKSIQHITQNQSLDRHRNSNQNLILPTDIIPFSVALAWDGWMCIRGTFEKLSLHFSDVTSLLVLLLDHLSLVAE